MAWIVATSLIYVCRKKTFRLAWKPKILQASEQTIKQHNGIIANVWVRAGDEVSESRNVHPVVIHDGTDKQV